MSVRSCEYVLKFATISCIHIYLNIAHKNKRIFVFLIQDSALLTANKRNDISNHTFLTN